MRHWFLNREEAENAYKSRLENMLAYLDKKGILTIEDIEKENIKNRKRIAANEKQILFFTNTNSLFWDAPQFLYNKLEKLRRIDNALYTASEMCVLFKVDNTSTFTKEMISDENVSKIVDLACKQEEERNKKVDLFQSGFKSNYFCKIREQNKQNEESQPEIE